MTPADKPDLPPKRPAGVDETMRELRSAFIDVRIHAMRAITVCEYIELLEQKVADERRKALYEAETLIRQRLDAATRCHAFTEGQYSEGQRDAYSVAALDIRALIDKEPTK